MASKNNSQQNQQFRTLQEQSAALAEEVPKLTRMAATFLITCFLVSMVFNALTSDLFWWDNATWHPTLKGVLITLGFGFPGFGILYLLLKINENE